MSDSERPQGWESIGASFRGAEVAAPAFDLDVDALRARTSKFARTIRRRNLREAVAGVVVAACGVRIAWNADRALVAFGGTALTLAALLVTGILWLRARNIASPPIDAPTCAVLAYERAQLDRQARLLGRAWLWYIAPFLPSVLAIYANALLRAIEKGGEAIAVVVALFVVTLAVFVLVGWLNARAARRLREQMVLLP